MNRSRSLKRAGSESSGDSLSLPPPSPAPDQLHLDHAMMGPYSLSSPDSLLMSGSTDPMLSMPAPASPGSDQHMIPTVLGSPHSASLLVSVVSVSSSTMITPGTISGLCLPSTNHPEYSPSCFTNTAVFHSLMLSTNHFSQLHQLTINCMNSLIL